MLQKTRRRNSSNPKHQPARMLAKYVELAATSAGTGGKSGQGNGGPTSTFSKWTATQHKMELPRQMSRKPSAVCCSKLRPCRLKSCQLKVVSQWATTLVCMALVKPNPPMDNGKTFAGTGAAGVPMVARKQSHTRSSCLSERQTVLQSHHTQPEIGSCRCAHQQQQRARVGVLTWGSSGTPQPVHCVSSSSTCGRKLGDRLVRALNTLIPCSSGRNDESHTIRKDCFQIFFLAGNEGKKCP